MRQLLFYIILFSLLGSDGLNAQVNANNLFHKTWKTKSYGAKFLNVTYSIYNKDSVNNSLDYVNKTFTFSDTGTYIGKDVKNDSIFHGKWKINAKGDSMTLDGKRKYLNLLDANNLITSVSYLQYADTSGKVDTVVYYLHLYSIPDITSVNQTDDNSSFTVFPNPSSNSFKIQFTSGDKEVSSIRLTDISGRRVGEQMVSTRLKETEIDIRYLKAGIYFVELIGKNNTTLGKKHIIKQ